MLKEIEQESGFTARVVKLAAVYDRNKHDHPPYLFHAWKLFFICEITGGEARTSYETDCRRVLPAGRPAGAVDGPLDRRRRFAACTSITSIAHLPTEFD